MSDIPIPQKGSPITLEWGKAVTESCNAARAIGTGGLVRSGPFGLGEAPLPANHRDRRLQSKLAPFAIKLKPKTDDVEAQWIIYLPSEKILSYNNEAISPLGKLTAADGMNDWYVLNIALTGGTVYLNISTEDESESESDESVAPSIEYSLESSEKISIAIAEVSYDEQTKSVSICQYVTSALHLSNGSDGVKSLNELKGDIEIAGGNEIEVLTVGQKIVIGYKKGKPADNPSDDSSDYQDPCDHDSAGSAGGVKPDDGAGPGADDNNDSSAGGVPAQGGELHAGDNDCNCP